MRLADENSECRQWVTIVLTCYNQAPFLKDALRSILQQTYPYIEIIIVDNASEDGSQEIIDQFVKDCPSAIYIQNPHNLGLCQAFNQGLEKARGRYIIDFSGDDQMFPERVAKQVPFFMSMPLQCGLIFGNAEYLSSKSEWIGIHFPVDMEGRTRIRIPSGMIYEKILERYFICAPTCMMRTDLLRKIGGYDPNLAFEDFDLWVRFGRDHALCYQDEILTKVRRHAGSLSHQILERDNAILRSTLLVCRKAYALNRTLGEHQLLAARLRTFIRKCWYSHSFALAEDFRILLNQIEKTGYFTEIFVVFCRLRLPINRVYRIINRIFNFRGPTWIVFDRSIVCNKNQNAYVRRIYSNISRKSR